MSFATSLGSRISICCKNDCVHGLSESEIVTTRNIVWAMNHKQQRKWLLAHFAAIYSHNTRQFTHTICGKPVCLRAWLFATNISKSRYYEIRGQFLNGYLGDDSPLHTRFIVATEMAMQWLEVYANENGDKLPNAKKVLLPSSMTKSFVYDQYAEEYKGSGYAVSRSTFFKHWDTTCQHIIIPKRSRFTKCTLCDLFSKKIPVEKNKDRKEALKTSRAGHLKRVRVEREKYYSHCVKSRHNPDGYITVIVDGMDQQKTCIPHFVSQSKATSNKQQLKVHIVGALTHGHGAYVYMGYGQFPEDSNLTATVLMKCLENIAKEKGHMPPVLYIQMDNCSGQNKNKFILALLSYLVQHKVFRKIKLSFLPVGHTHEDVDQMFSRFSLYLEKHDAVTPQELVTAIEASYTPTPKVYEIKETYNIKDLFQPYLEDIHGHTGPHHFRFRLVGEEVELKYKNWSTEKEWLPVSENINVLRAGCPTLCSLVPPNAEELGLEKLMNDIKHQSEYISPAQSSEWEVLVDRLLHQEASCEPVHLPILQWSSATSPLRSASMMNTESAQVHDPAIAKLLQKESEQHEVYNGKLKRQKKTAARGDETPVVGDLVAVLPAREQYTGQPWIGKCLQYNTATNTTMIEWYRGSYTTPWRPDKRHEPAEVAAQSILAFGFKLTETGRLRSKIKKTLKDSLQDY